MMKEFIIVTTFAVIIGIVDIASFKIPDMLLAGLFLTLTAIDMVSRSYTPLLMSLASAVALFTLFFITWRCSGGMGFGDVKYAGVIGYALGFQKALYACLAASLLGIVCFVVCYCFSPHRKSGTLKKKTKIPFGPFLSCGLILLSVDRLIH